MSSNGLRSNEHRPRLCHLRRWPDFAGYGFNLHCEKSKLGQYIGKVDEKSPAASAGLYENDRIIEVNFVPIGTENHKQVVQRIKEGVTRNGSKYPDEVILLVVDPKTDEYYKNKSIVIKSSDPNVLKLEAKSNPDDSPHSSDRDDNQGDDSPPIARKPSPQIRSAESNRDYTHVTDFTGPVVVQSNNVDSPATSRPYSQNYVNADDRNTNMQLNYSASDKDKRSNISQTSSSSPANGSRGVFELKMSAAEYREKIKSLNPRKRDPRHTNQMSMKQKHDVIDRL
ncbi:unnamed protein product [Rotaria socialis]|uniref:PDZ domain-containing protein n=1 Tax=Rotaria socialis TaxID=392032 RepID=A0A817NJK8_9BILA|nr:unnamed protein product [Rotaria socialis]CAF3296598.1 unnamed protein product [Rotaria socialis]CAF3328099.1 unnamed protein product [Rotaria socialis]CAF3411597.1 unnamed protein product [Rotaria socialis]CAF3708774.1 unnamed protein product [Rotaria socialis]